MDSFVYNLVDQLRNNSCNVIIFRNTLSYNLIIKKLKNIKNPILMLSPGPGIPSKSGCMPKLIKILKGYIPIIGICLGYQAIVELYGGNIEKSKVIIHGQSSQIKHDNKYMFYGLPNPLSVARYHSFICNNIPNLLTINSKFNDTVMSVRDNKNKICGFQFHPESIMTTQGTLLIKQTINWVKY